MPDRFKRIESLYHAARLRLPEERQVFIIEACAGDEDLRREVESLLAMDSAAEGFLSDVISRAPTLAVGARVGVYQIVARIGTGGMGEVYRAHDSKLGRDVAIKVLPPTFATDADRQARFEREARLLASLNHTNIAQVYGFEESNGTRALVMELIEGDTLAERIARGPIPVDDVLPVARQIASALAVAHDHGIIHRDLKPANIKLRPDGAVKVLDFGLAKAMSATLASTATVQGAILGTAPYMSPEQAAGKTVDRRTDLWAFGVVLMEMLTGRPVFDGESIAHVLSSILKDEPDWSTLPVDTPAAVRRLLRRCLAKDPTRRLDSAADARLELDDANEAKGAGLETAPSPFSNGGPERTAAGIRRGVRVHLTWLAVCLLSAGAAWAITAWAKNRTPVPVPPERRAEITTPATSDLVSLALSPDGQKLVFVAYSDHRPKLWLRSLVTGSTQVLSGTDGATFPFWSPDSRSIGFFAYDNLCRIDVDGGSFRKLAFAPLGVGGTWNRNGEILFTLVPDAPVSRVSAESGAPSDRLKLRLGGGGQRFPQFLPDGRHFLYYVAGPSDRGVYAASLDNPQGQRIFDADAAAVFAPPDRVVFVRANKLYVQRINFTTLKPVGEAVAIAQGISVDAFGAAAVSVSATGSIVFRSGPANGQRQLAWFDRFGTPLGAAADPDDASPFNPVLSPDGRSVALNRSVGGNTDIWLLDLARGGVRSPFTSDPRPEIFPVWSPDGAQVAYAKQKPGGGGFDIEVKNIGGAGEEASLVESSQNMLPEDWSRDGRFLSYIFSDSANRFHLGALELEHTGTHVQVKGKPIEITNTPFNEVGGQFSPDRHWIAFESDETGHNEIYVLPFPGPGQPKIVSKSGGLQPAWSRNGRELFYVAPDGQLMAVGITVTPSGDIEASSPIPLFMTRISTTRTGGTRNDYAIDPRGQQRFLMNTFVEQNAAPITLVLNAATLND